MAISKVQIDSTTLIDLTSDTAVETDVASGKTFHKADGTIATGTASGGGFFKTSFVVEECPTITVSMIECMNYITTSEV